VPCLIIVEDDEVVYVKLKKKEQLPHKWMSSAWPNRDTIHIY